VRLALVESFCLLFFIVTPHLTLHCRLRCSFAVFAEFVDRPDLHSCLGGLYSVSIRGTEPKEGKCNNQQDHPKSIFNCFWDQTHMTALLSGRA